MPDFRLVSNLELIGEVIDWIGVGVILVAGLLTVWVGTKTLVEEGTHAAYTATRRTFGRGLLVGLEVLIAADLIRTIAVDLTLDSVAALGLLVVVRTILSLSIEVEIDGRFPWQSGPDDS